MGLLPPLLLIAGLGPAVPNAPDRIVLILIDDVGVDRIGAYAEHPDPGRTPNLDSLAARGLLFRNAWSNPYCSPTRAALLTGRYGFRTGIGATVRGPGMTGFQAGLDPNQVSLPDALGPGWRSLCMGKWHLADETQPIEHPLELGFEHYAGGLYNLGSGVPSPGYYNWLKTIDGVQIPSGVYATTDPVEDSVRALEDPQPTFLWLAFHAAHTPRHVPPDNLHTYTLSGDPDDTPVVHTKAMIEAMDTEIGRVLEILGPNDLVFVIGDNGTDGDATDAPFIPERSKGTMYEGGVGVPLIVAGPGVPVGECAALVNVTDIFATVCELTGRVSKAEDSVSLVPYFQDPSRSSLRPWIYAESFRPNGPGPAQKWSQAIRGERFKVILRKNRPDEFYDLDSDPFENQNLLLAPLPEEASAAYQRLRASLPTTY